MRTVMLKRLWQIVVKTVHGGHELDHEFDAEFELDNDRDKLTGNEDDDLVEIGPAARRPVTVHLEVVELRIMLCHLTR